MDRENCLFQYAEVEWVTWTGFLKDFSCDSVCQVSWLYNKQTRRPSD